MVTFLAATALAFVAIFVAEFGDKSQLLILAFATRYSARPVIIGLVIAATVIQGLSVAVGAAVGAALPEATVAIVGGVAFMAVAAWTLRSDDDDDAAAESTGPGSRAGIGLVLAVAGTFILGELGDKTMLATFALAASQGPIPTWVGSTAGEVAANLVAVVVGRQVGHRLSPRLVRLGSATLFALGGIALLAGGLIGLD
jgi:Ca2+/H+ antiporter, TMEM165/GDT1 family